MTYIVSEICIKNNKKASICINLNMHFVVMLLERKKKPIILWKVQILLSFKNDNVTMMEAILKIYYINIFWLNRRASASQTFYCVQWNTCWKQQVSIQNLIPVRDDTKINNLLKNKECSETKIFNETMLKSIQTIINSLFKAVRHEI